MRPVKPRIYLAGKVGGVKFKAVEYLKGEADFYCSDGGNHSEHEWGVATYSFGEDSYRELMGEMVLGPIRLADGLLAVVDTPDSFGTVAEIAFASATGTPALVVVIEPAGWVTSGSEGFSRPSENYLAMFDAYWFVTSFPGVRVEVVKSLDEARDHAAQFVLEVA